ncbi:MAG: ABC transporter substrate-binding protein [Bacteroidetes bacterium]|nr:ABC transporter substrate-binding protein [Bacteroidota bacterium]
MSPILDPGHLLGDAKLAGEQEQNSWEGWYPMFRFILGAMLVVVLVAGCAVPASTSTSTAPSVSKPSATAAPAAPASAGPTSAATAKPAASTGNPRPGESPPATAVKIKRGGVLRVATRADWPTLDPHMTSGEVKLDLYDPLVRLDKDEKTGMWEVKPQLAESWAMPDPKTVIMKLRQGVKFHDGTAFDAASAKWNLDRMREHPKSMAKETVIAIQSVDVVDPSTIRVNLKAPTASFLVSLTPGTSTKTGMVSKAAVDKLGDEGFARQPVGTGPMQFVEWLAGDHVTVKKFDGYWDKGEDGLPLPYLDGITERLITDDSVRLLELRAGNLDVIDRVQGKDVPGVKSNPDLVYQEVDAGTFYMVSFNPNGGPFADNPKLRQAALYALNRDAMAQTLGMGIAKPANYFVAPGQPGYDTANPKYDYNPDRAKSLLREAGHPEGLDVSLTIIARELDQRQAQMMKQMLDAVGIRTEIDAVDRLAWINKVRGGTFDFATMNPSYAPDPDYTMSRIMVSGAAGNYVGWKNPDMDKCLEEGRSTYDSKQRDSVYKRCQKIVYDTAMHDNMWFQPVNFVYNKKVKGLRFEWAHDDDKYVWLDR